MRRKRPKIFRQLDTELNLLGDKRFVHDFVKLFVAGLKYLRLHPYESAVSGQTAAPQTYYGLKESFGDGHTKSEVPAPRSEYDFTSLKLRVPAGAVIELPKPASPVAETVKPALPAEIVVPPAEPVAEPTPFVPECDKEFVERFKREHPEYRYTK